MENKKNCICYVEINDDIIFNLQDILHIEEKKKIENSSDSRKREFTAGRLAAKNALVQVAGKDISLSQICILNDSQGAPYFTEAQYFCSISHNKEFAIAAVSDINELRIGIDIQKQETIKKEMINYYMNTREKRLLKGYLNNYNADYLYTVVWSAKESMSKLLQYGFALFGLLEIDTIEPLNNYIIIYFKGMKALGVRVENLGNSVVSVATYKRFLTKPDQEFLNLQKLTNNI